MIHVVQRMREFAIQLLTKKMKRVNVIVKRMLVADDAIHVWKVFGIWMQIIRWAAKNVRVIFLEQSVIVDVTCILVNVCANVWLLEKTVINVCQKRLVYQPLKTVVNCVIVIWVVRMIIIVTCSLANAHVDRICKVADVTFQSKTISCHRCISFMKLKYHHRNVKLAIQALE